MKIVSFVYCNDVNNENGNTILISPMQMLTPIGIPSNYSFTVSFGLLDRYEKFNNNEVIIKFVDDTDKEISKNVFTFPPLPEELKKSPDPIGIQINIGFRNVILEKAGIFSTVIECNNSELGRYPIDVFVPKQN